ncbi:uncharacterized protein LOC109536806 isoform X1 [Dendroctonus ponderosae]|uniref:uncharacterized protein LOC109536806 isoform X1 n=1 Tax=Dendroctonus ponderosae TaxID=77166 RepID=UPI002035E4A4|nr:uncharacterized protein LOC109536806 isoform X1 [Dendroctonus ponderosae]XP_019758756.2 uncharacterized protein LOC109536806 isoform X1 [Dendroctonus ponderosae]
MKVFNLSMMLTVQLNYVLLILSLFATVCSFPSTPLSRKNQEISWEAWLLVDDQNQNRQTQGEHMPKHRITAKSVFVAPTFSPKDLPPCAEGYNSDSMGRCIKIIKLREDNQLTFLLSKLNAEFGSELDYDSIPEEPNSAPTKVDIPLIMDFGDDYGSEFEEEHDMAIIVTQTAKSSDNNGEDNNTKFDKRDQKLHVDVLEDELKKLTKVTTEKYQVKTETEPMSTTEVEELSTSPYSTPEKTTTMEDNVDSTITPTTIIMPTEETTIVDSDGSYSQTEFSDTTTEISTTTTTNSESTSVLPITTEESETTTLPSSSGATSTTPKITTYHPVATTYHPYFDLGQVANARTKNFVKFPSEEVVMPRSHPNGNYIRFPDFDSKYQQESLIHHTRDVDDQTGNFFNEIVTPEPSEQIQGILLPPKRHYNFDARRVDGELPADLQRRSNPYGKAHVLPDNEEQYQFPFATTEQFANKRAREKYGNTMPPKWSSEDIHKPIVLRFSRKHFNFNNNKFKNSEFYRSLPTDDLTYLFGHKNGHTSHR